MMFMPDCLEATWKIMTAPAEKLTRSTYNVTAMSFRCVLVGLDQPPSSHSSSESLSLPLSCACCPTAVPRS
jgi:hypothetical protein